MRKQQRKLQIISGKFQNDAINDVKEISLSHVIKKEIYCKIAI